MSDSIILARIKRNNKTFEISVDPQKAQDFKQGNASLAEALMSDEIFIDAKRGQLASAAELEEVFKTADKGAIAKIILMHGEIQTTSEQRNKEREDKRKRLVHKIHSLAVDPKTSLPHPPQRIEAALQEAKVHLKDHQTIDQQFEEILSKLRPIIPIKIEVKKLKVTLEAKFLGTCNAFIRTQKMLKEDWTNEGHWQVTLEIPAGLVPDFIEQINGKTSGSAQVEFIKE